MFRIFPSTVKTIVLQMADTTYKLDVLCTELYKKGTSFECQCIWNERANWGHYFYVSYWRRDRHLRGHPSHAKVKPLARSAKEYLYFSIILRP